MGQPSEKVLFGTELLTFMGIDLTYMAGPYGSLQFLLDQFASPYGCFSMKSDDDDVFDANLCTDPRSRAEIDRPPLGIVPPLG